MKLPCIRLLAHLLSLGLAIFTGWTPSLAAGELRGGVAKVEITPKDPVMLAGYASRKEPSRAVHDSLFARVVALEENEHRLALVSIDN